MQTFLPYPDFVESLKCLDNQRLGKQRVETGQLLRSLGVRVPKADGSIPDPSTRRGWLNHPALLMWVGYANALSAYYNASLDEWERRGFENKMPRIGVLDAGHSPSARFFLLCQVSVDNPPWIGDERFHASHRSNLLRKDPVFYSQFGWKEEPDIPYYWPVTKNDNKETSVNEVDENSIDG